ncbi:VCBS repeat-containing protein [Imperialibacter roseus]|uniref:VCBS repeat-containing protein n=1 Tax=Imperialibacter roseus TaxID=1324217 RepID=A0ABZ0IUW9_9BACT|nr:VCBS repeat-containing protein [Imperialibacter roseus]WOK08292.1 VCBS repeat-containing protein [Imperialibacter roseus]
MLFKLQIHLTSIFGALLLLSILAACETKTDVVSTPEEKKEVPVFKRLPGTSSGVTFRNDVDENYDNYFDNFAYVYNGGGVGIGDINNDGLADIYFTGNEVPNKLYLNEGDLKFKDISQSAGVEGNGRWNNGVTMVDINGDGLLDIYVCKGGYHDSEEKRTNLLYINQGDLTFKEQAKEFGLDESGYSIHASFFDMDNDNDLDVYLTNRPDSFDLPLTEMIRQKKLSPSFSRDKLYKNENGKFREIGVQAGIKNNFGYALSVVTADFNGDGYTDIFVANDFAEGDYMYINQKNGTFKEQIKETTNHISMYSMGTDVADINNDGLEDIMVTEMLPEDYKRSKVSMPSMDVEGFYNIVNGGMHKQYMHNALHLNQGNSFFGDISQMAGVSKTEWSWSVLMSDFDNDGYRDVFVANGYRRDVFDGDLDKKLRDFVLKNKSKYTSMNDMLKNGYKDFIEVYDPIKVKNYLFRNTGNLHFENAIDSWGFDETSFSNGAAVGDLDNDGDLELVINNLDDEAFIYENTSSDRNNYLKVKLDGPATNADGMGAKVTIYYDGKIQFFENKTVRGYLSSNDPIVHFGLGQAAGIDSLRVSWLDGTQNTMSIAGVNQTVVVSYEKAVKPKKLPASKELLFQASPGVLAETFVHKENEVNEYKDQTLLPHNFSMSGPFMSTGDVNGDEEDDLFIGGASGQAGQLYIQSKGKLAKKSTAAFAADKSYEDMGSTLFDADGDGDLDLYVVSGGSEFPDKAEQYKDRLYLNDGKGNFAKSATINTQSSGSVVVPYDIDGDGDLDLFRGGHVITGAYPYSPRSYVLINESGQFIDQTKALAPDLTDVGMVTSAIWADLNGDKTAELVIVGEWMPVMVFANVNGKLKNATVIYGLDKTEGWWNKVVANDIDGDGDQDLIVGNLGENYKFKTNLEKPFQVFAKDFDNNGTNDIFLARYYNDSVLVPVRGIECSSGQVPSIRQKFPSYLSFASSDLQSILGPGMNSALNKKVYTFSNAILVNNDAKFESKKLPIEAQLSAVNGILVEDFDGDGIKDLLVAGNKFDTEVETTPNDASPGAFLKGLGNFEFKAAGSLQSGFFVPFNVKDVQMIKSGKNWLVLVSSNNDMLRIFSTSRATSDEKVALNK